MNMTVQATALSSRALRVLAPPVFVIGVEWLVSATNKLIGNFVSAFPSYMSSLAGSHIFLPGLFLFVRFPVVVAWLAIVTETSLGIALVLSSFFFLRGANRLWKVVAGTALGVSAIVAVGLWLIVGRPAFWPNGNGFGSGFPVEFFLVTISAALALALAFADPGATPIARVGRFLRRRNS